MLIKIYPDNPTEKAISQVIDILSSGDGVIIYPTDSVYAFGCSLHSPKALEKLRGFTDKKTGELSLVFSDISSAANYAKIDNNIFRTLKRNLPGPFTFILEALSRVPDKFLERRHTIGIRIPDCSISLALVDRLGNPMVTSSVKDPDEILEYTTDPSLIHERYKNLVDAVIDCGYGNNNPTTIVDCTSGEPEIMRQGLGILK